MLDFAEAKRLWCEASAFAEPVKISRRQSTAFGALLNHAFAVENDDRLRHDAEHLFFHATRLVSSRSTDLARRLLRRIAALQELEDRAWILLGQLEEAEQHWPEARDAYARAWDLSRARAWELSSAFDESHAELGCKLAWAQVKSGEVDAAEQLLESLAERCPENATVKELLRIARSPSARV